MKSLSWTAVLMLVSATCLPGTAAVVVNGEPLDAQTHRALEQRYGRLQPGYYWYDAMSGLWGREGGPSLGQIVAGLHLAPMASNASVNNVWMRTWVFVNGREIHPREYAMLQQLFGQVNPGRYWLNAQGIAGYEGGPPQFDLRAAAMARSPGRGNSGGGYTRRGAFGNTGSDGNCGFYNDVDSGASVMVGEC